MRGRAIETGEERKLREARQLLRGVQNYDQSAKHLPLLSEYIHKPVRQDAKA